MDLFSPEALRQLALFAPPFILCLSIHEWAHAWSANKLGDSTAKDLGRLTIDPMAHISLFGTIIFPAISLLTGAPLFGWAKPVPVNPRNFTKPRQHMAWVAAAGPISNFLQAFVLTALLSALLKGSFGFLNLSTSMNSAVVQMLIMAVQLNLFLAFFNLIPVPPLDGSRILQGIGSYSFAEKIERFGQYGQWVILILFITGGLRILAIPVYKCLSWLFMLFEINY